ncbi:DNA topology modulation protein FlaR [Paraliobacillus sp. X-1268]|uniref:DNA topology modulation protein FlaR n=1 Tax=Paraliobacillus sp. X-1268 TaxID=2213193 RepID=UPI003515F706
MEKGITKKVHIIGSVGSGKTTLARMLSDKLAIPHYELDNVVWKRAEPSDIRRSEQDRDNYLKEIVNLNSWIIEGAHYEWVSSSLQQADLIIYLDIAVYKRIYQIIKRFYLQKVGVEKANYKPTVKMLWKMFVWTYHFEKEGKQKIAVILVSYNQKLIIIKDKYEINTYI